MTLDDYGVRAELTATARVGVHRYAFPEGKPAHVLLDLRTSMYDYPGKVSWSRLRLRSDGTVTGFRETRGWAPGRQLYFALRFSKPIAAHAFHNTETDIPYKGFATPGDRDLGARAQIEGRQLVGTFDFGAASREPLLVKVSISPVSEDGAIANLDAEMPDWDFERVRAAAKSQWIDALSAVDVDAPEPTIARMAEAMGRAEVAATFAKRAENWRNVFDPKTGFLRARKRDGSFREPFDATASGYGTDYTEGNAWQYSWYVPQDVAGLAAAHGGADKLLAKLDQAFDAKVDPSVFEHMEDITGLIGWYAHGNEPSHHVAYLYAHAGQPWRTQARLQQIMETQYKPAPDGLAGNDDLGQMSAWFVFTALGFYPAGRGCGAALFDVGAMNHCMSGILRK